MDKVIFLFNKYDNEFWQSSLLIEVNISGGLRLEYIPIVKEGNGIRLATGRVKEDILKAFYQRSDEILRDGFVEQQYRQFAGVNLALYLQKFSGIGKWMSRIDRRLLNCMLIRKKYNKSNRNYIECDADRELVFTGLKVEGILTDNER